MLVLTRKTAESIIIANDIKIKILSIDGGTAKIGISAPKEISVHREELYIKIQNEKEAQNEQTTNKN